MASHILSIIFDFIEVPDTPPRPKSMAPSSREMIDGEWMSGITARAAFAYISAGENQLSFHEGDLIILIGEFALKYCIYSHKLIPILKIINVVILLRCDL